MTGEYFILLSDGSRDGPYAEEELLDFISTGELDPDTPCLHAASGKVSEAGVLFQVVAPAMEESPPSGPVPWTPAPFPQDPAAAAPARTPSSTVRLLYRGNPCIITYWGSVLIAAACIGLGIAFKDRHPSLLAVGLLAGMFVLLLATLRRLRTHYYISSARVETVSGLLARSSREIRIADIRAITVSHHGLTGLLGIGTIIFSSSSDAQDDVIFTRVWRPGALTALVRRLQDSP